MSNEMSSNGSSNDMVNNGLIITGSAKPLPAGVTLPLYMDNHATTPMDPRVLEAMMPYLTEWYGNPSSVHRFGQKSRHAIDEARSQVASLIGSSDNEISFTGGGTEARGETAAAVIVAITEGPMD